MAVFPAQVIPDTTKNHRLFYILSSGSVVLNNSLDYTMNTFFQLKILAQVGDISPWWGQWVSSGGEGRYGTNGCCALGWWRAAAQRDSHPEQHHLPVHHCHRCAQPGPAVPQRALLRLCARGLPSGEQPDPLPWGWRCPRAVP